MTTDDDGRKPPPPAKLATALLAVGDSGRRHGQFARRPHHVAVSVWPAARGLRFGRPSHDTWRRGPMWEAVVKHVSC